MSEQKSLNLFTAMLLYWAIFDRQLDKKKS